MTTPPNAPTDDDPGDGPDEAPTESFALPEPRDESTNQDATVDDAQRSFPPPGGAGFTDPQMLAGRPGSTYVHIVVLALAAAADLGAFYQVIARVMAESNEFFVYLVLIGFTATVLYLGHVIGLMLRNRKANYESISMGAIVLCVVVLAGLAALAFYVRLTTPIASTAAPPGGFSSAPTTPATVPAAAHNTQLASAAVFLGLFVATVTVAAIGAYLTHNPLRERYAVAVRAYRKQAAIVASTDAAHIRDAGLRASADAHRENAKLVERAQRQHMLALAEELKKVAQVRILAARKDPALTDSWSPEDPRPYKFHQDGPPNG